MTTSTDKALPQVPSSIAALFERLSLLAWENVEQLNDSIDEALNILVVETADGRSNPPNEAHADAPWLWLIHAVQKASPTLTVRVASRWYRHLNEHDRSVKTFSPHRAIGPYVAGFVELQRNNVATARRWLHIAAIEDARNSHHGAARTLLTASLGESASAIESLYRVTREAPTAPGSLLAESEYTPWLQKIGGKTA